MFNRTFSQFISIGCSFWLSANVFLSSELCLWIRIDTFVRFYRKFRDLSSVCTYYVRSETFCPVSALKDGNAVPPKALCKIIILVSILLMVLAMAKINISRLRRQLAFLFCLVIHSSWCSTWHVLCFLVSQWGKSDINDNAIIRISICYVSNVLAVIEIVVIIVCWYIHFIRLFWQSRRVLNIVKTVPCDVLTAVMIAGPS